MSGDTSMLSDLPILVINLDRSTDRLAEISETLGSSGLTWQRLKGVELQRDIALSHPMYRSERARALYRKDLTAGEIGCFLSHCSALEKFVASNHQEMLVLEDDVVALTDSASRISALLEALRGRPGLKWSNINLAETYVKRRRFLFHAGGCDVYRAYDPPMLAAALLWSRPGAEFVLRQIDSQGICEPVDQQFRTILARRGDALSIQAPVFMLRGVPTTIAGRREIGEKRKFKFDTAYFRRKYLNYVWALVNRTMQK